MSELTTPKMSHEEMMDTLKGLVFGTFDRTTSKEREALDMAISALSEEISEDGTLTVHVKDGSKVSRVLVMGENIFGGLYYPDSDKIPKNGERFSCPNCGFKADWYILDSAENKREWIPVTERLPEEREWYLAVFKEKDTDFQLIPRVADYIGHGENKWRWIDEEGIPQEYFDLLECIAWQPLPEPIRKENDIHGRFDKQRKSNKQCI